MIRETSVKMGNELKTNISKIREELHSMKTGNFTAVALGQVENSTTRIKLYNDSDMTALRKNISQIQTKLKTIQLNFTSQLSNAKNESVISLKTSEKSINMHLKKIISHFYDGIRTVNSKFSEKFENFQNKSHAESLKVAGQISQINDLISKLKINFTSQISTILENSSSFRILEVQDKMKLLRANVTDPLRNLLEKTQTASEKVNEIEGVISRLFDRTESAKNNLTRYSKVHENIKQPLEEQMASMSKPIELTLDVESSHDDLQEIRRAVSRNAEQMGLIKYNLTSELTKLRQKLNYSLEFGESENNVSRLYEFMRLMDSNLTAKVLKLQDRTASTLDLIELKSQTCNRGISENSNQLHAVKDDLETQIRLLHIKDQNMTGLFRKIKEEMRLFLRKNQSSIKESIKLKNEIQMLKAAFTADIVQMKNKQDIVEEAINNYKSKTKLESTKMKTDFSKKIGEIQTKILLERSIRQKNADNMIHEATMRREIMKLHETMKVLKANITLDVYDVVQIIKASFSKKLDKLLTKSDSTLNIINLKKEISLVSESVALVKQNLQVKFSAIQETVDSTLSVTKTQVFKNSQELQELQEKFSKDLINLQNNPYVVSSEEVSELKKDYDSLKTIESELGVEIKKLQKEVKIATGDRLEISRIDGMAKKIQAELTDTKKSIQILKSEFSNVLRNLEKMSSVDESATTAKDASLKVSKNADKIRDLKADLEDIISKQGEHGPDLISLKTDMSQFHDTMSLVEATFARKLAELKSELIAASDDKVKKKMSKIFVAMKQMKAELRADIFDAVKATKSSIQRKLIRLEDKSEAASKTDVLKNDVSRNFDDIMIMKTDFAELQSQLQKNPNGSPADVAQIKNDISQLYDTIQLLEANIAASKVARYRGNHEDNHPASINEIKNDIAQIYRKIREMKADFTKDIIELKDANPNTASVVRLRKVISKVYRLTQQTKADFTQDMKEARVKIERDFAKLQYNLTSITLKNTKSDEELYNIRRVVQELERQIREGMDTEAEDEMRRDINNLNNKMNMMKLSLTNQLKNLKNLRNMRGVASSKTKDVDQEIQQIHEKILFIKSQLAEKKEPSSKSGSAEGSDIRKDVKRLFKMIRTMKAVQAADLRKFVLMWLPELFNQNTTSTSSGALLKAGVLKTKMSSRLPPMEKVSYVFNPELHITI